jgi:hypothetical protein
MEGDESPLLLAPVLLSPARARVVVDFQVVFPQEVIELSSIRLLPGITPKTLDILGKDFRAVDEVQINEVASPSVVVISRTRLLAQVPSSLGASSVQTVSVVSNRLTISKKSILRFRVGRVASKVRGILRLVQLFTKILFTRPGSDIFFQRTGGDALRNVGRTFGKSQSGSIVSDFVIAVNTARQQIVAIQSRDPSIPLDEKLLTARVRSSHFSPQQGALIVSVEVLSQAGQAAVANVVV